MTKWGGDSWPTVLTPGTTFCSVLWSHRWRSRTLQINAHTSEWECWWLSNAATMEPVLIHTQNTRERQICPSLSWTGNWTQAAGFTGKCSTRVCWLKNWWLGKFSNLGLSPVLEWITASSTRIGFVAAQYSVSTSQLMLLVQYCCDQVTSIFGCWTWLGK